MFRPRRSHRTARIWLVPLVAHAYSAFSANFALRSSSLPALSTALFVTELPSGRSSSIPRDERLSAILSLRLEVPARNTIQPLVQLLELESMVFEFGVTAASSSERASRLSTAGRLRHTSSPRRTGGILLVR